MKQSNVPSVKTVPLFSHWKHLISTNGDLQRGQKLVFLSCQGHFQRKWAILDLSGRGQRWVFWTGGGRTGSSEPLSSCVLLSELRSNQPCVSYSWHIFPLRAAWHLNLFQDHGMLSLTKPLLLQGRGHPQLRVPWMSQPHTSPTGISSLRNPQEDTGLPP